MANCEVDQSQPDDMKGTLRPLSDYMKAQTIFSLAEKVLLSPDSIRFFFHPVPSQLYVRMRAYV